MNFEEVFLKQLRINSGDIVREKDNLHEKLLHERKFHLDEEFKLSNETIQSLTKLNTILKAKELIIYEDCKKLEVDILVKSKNKFSDYEIKISIDLYSSSISNKFKKYDLDFIYSDYTFLIFTKKDFAIQNGRDNNWTEFVLLNSHQFYGQIPICRSLFNLIEYSYLSLTDILLIDKFWWDIKVTYQYMEKLK
jgi:hypothetical protein